MSLILCVSLHVYVSRLSIDCECVCVCVIYIALSRRIDLIYSLFRSVT